MFSTIRRIEAIMSLMKRQCFFIRPRNVSFKHTYEICVYLLTYSMEQSPSWEANQYTLQLVKKFPAFMESESFSPYPQVPATCPYPEPTPSSPHDPLQLSKDTF
jgi:hypothetical protein